MRVVILLLSRGAAEMVKDNAVSLYSSSARRYSMLNFPESRLLAQKLSHTLFNIYVDYILIVIKL